MSSLTARTRTSAALARNIARAVLGLPLAGAPAMPGAVALSATERARYVGSYSMQTPNAERTPARVVEDSARLVLEVTTPSGAQRWRLVPIGGDVFAVEGAPGARVYFTVTGGRATEFLFDRGHRPLAASLVR